MASEPSESPSAEDVTPVGELGGDTVLVGEDALGEDAVAPEPEPGSRVTIEPGDTTAAEPSAEDTASTEIVDDHATATAEAPAADLAPPPSAPETVVERRGPGFVPLAIGGVVAAALGYGAAFMGLRPATDEPVTDPALVAALAQIETQQDTLAGLADQIAALAAIEPPVIPEVDLSAIEGAVAGIAGQVTGVGDAVEALAGRVTALEERPVFTGNVDEDSAAMATAVETLEARLAEERNAAAEAIAAAEAAQQAAAAELQAASDAAQAAIAEAEARAQATASATRAQAALSRVRIAMAAGDPFADALAELGADAPEALSAAAETGVPTIEDLQSTFPAAARAALAVAIRETADDTVMGGLGAFLQNQLGGRSVVPREGNDPDAVLSRAGAAVDDGDLGAALSEIEALPDPAQAELSGWTSRAESRIAATAALAELAATLDN